MTTKWAEIQQANPGFPKDPRGFRGDEDVVRFKLCPDCGGKGYFTIEPFSLHPGFHNCCQCQTCMRAKVHFERHGCLPDDLARLCAAKGAANGQ